IGQTTAGPLTKATNMPGGTPERADIESQYYLFDSAIRPFWQLLKPLTEEADKPVDLFDIPNLGLKLKAYFDGYNDAQNTYIRYVRVSGIDPTQQDWLGQWRRADERALGTFRDLKSFPAKAELLNSWINEGYFETRSR